MKHEETAAYWKAMHDDQVRRKRILENEYEAVRKKAREGRMELVREILGVMGETTSAGKMMDRIMDICDREIRSAE